MLKIIFQVLAIVGVIIISILAFTLPSDPYEIIPAMSFDKPMWACYMFGGSFLYLLVLLGIYDIVNKKIA